MVSNIQFTLYFTHCVTRALVFDIIIYGPMLGPVSTILRLGLAAHVLVTTMIHGYTSEEQKPALPVVRDVRFWCETDFDLDLLYLWLPKRWRRRRKGSTTRNYNLRLRTSYRVVWVPMRDPVLRWLRPYTWKYLFRRRRIPTDAKQTHKTFATIKSLANFLMEGEDIASCDEADKAELLSKCALNPELCTQMCHELGVPDLESMRFLFTYGRVSTHHRLRASQAGIHPGHIDHVLKKVHPITLHRMETTVLSSGFYKHQRSEAHLRRSHQAETFLLTAEIASSVCHQLGRQYKDGPNNGKALAYNNCSHQPITPIVFDTGCSLSITPFKEDFISHILKPECSQIKGVGAATHPIKGVGLVKWLIYDMYGKEFVITTQAYLVPSSDIRLFSPQSYFQEQPRNDKSGAWVDRDGITLYIGSRKGKGYSFPYHPNNLIPYTLSKDKKHRSNKLTQFLTDDDTALIRDPTFMAQLFSVADETNQNLTAAQRELQIWHW